MLVIYSGTGEPWMRQATKNTYGSFSAGESEPQTLTITPKRVKYTCIQMRKDSTIITISMCEIFGFRLGFWKPVT